MALLKEIFKTYELSKAETRVAELIVTTGGSNKAIAEELCVTEGAIKFHVTSIFKKTGVKQRAQLIRKIMEQTI